MLQPKYLLGLSTIAWHRFEDWLKRGPNLRGTYIWGRNSHQHLQCTAGITRGLRQYLPRCLPPFKLIPRITNLPCMEFIKRLFGVGPEGPNGNENEESDPVSSEKVSPGLKHKRNKQVVVARHQPLLRALPMGAHGGVQGFEWFRQSMRRDEDGDYAIEFLEESQHKVERRRSTMDSIKHRRVNEMEGLCSKDSSPAGNSTTLLMKSGNITVLEE